MRKIQGIGQLRIKLAEVLHVRNALIRAIEEDDVAFYEAQIKKYKEMVQKLPNKLDVK